MGQVRAKTRPSTTEHKSPPTDGREASLARIPVRMYRSLVRGGYPYTMRERLATAVDVFVLHIHSARINPRNLRITYTFGLGLISVLLFIILAITGIFLMFYYVPSANEAYPRMQDISSVVTFGRLMRNAHKWAAEGMVVSVLLHLLRVFYTAAYKSPREFNWVVGAFLLVTTLGLSFTGYLLPWDQLAFWAITVGTNIAGYVPLIGEEVRFVLLGGQSVGGEALLRFYVLHIAVLPTLATALISYHLWRIRKDGGLAQPLHRRRRSNDGLVEPIPTFPKVVQVEALVFLLLTAALLLYSLRTNAPLEELADPLRPPNPAKAPWYFLGLQELVSYSAFWGGFVVPFALMVLIVLLPYVDINPRGIGRWFARERLPIMAVATLIVVAIVIFTLVGMLFRGPNWGFYSPWSNWPGPV